jgi:hypothetical protein
LPQPRRVWRGETAGQPETGIVDEQVDMFLMRSDVGHQPRGRARFGQVDRNRTRIAELCGKRVDPLFPPRHQHQRLAATGQLPSEFCAKPGRGARDEGDGCRHLPALLRRQEPRRREAALQPRLGPCLRRGTTPPSP